jgi:hypothetical protein
MKTVKEFSGNITNPTIKHLMDWIEAVDLYLQNESPFDCIEKYAIQLEHWRKKFSEEQVELESHWGDLVTVAVFGKEVILISDQRSGEFVKLTTIKKEVKNG